MPEIFSASSDNRKKFLAGLLASFYDHSPAVRFYDQHKDEKVILLLRRHWVTNGLWVLVSLLLLFLPFFGVSIFNLINFIEINLPLNFILVSFVFWYLATFGFIILNFLFWFYNVGIITNKRIIDVDFIYLLYNEITSTVIEKVEDVTSKRSGFLSIFFDIANVFVQTAGTEPNIEFINVPKPNLIVKIITQLLQGEK